MEIRLKDTIKFYKMHIVSKIGKCRINTFGIITEKFEQN